MHISLIVSQFQILLRFFQLQAAENETGLQSNPITITWLSGKPEPLYTMPDKVLTSEDTGRVTPDSISGVSSFPSSMPSFGFDPTKVGTNFRENCGKLF